MRHLLIVDDDNEFRETLKKALKTQGFRVTAISQPDALVATIAINRPDIVLLDMMFASGDDGLTVCQRLRTWNMLPVIVLSVLNDEETKVKMLDAGADDYLAKPFGINELLARVRAIERRTVQRQETFSPTIEIGDLTIDLESRMVKLQNTPIHLTPKEFTLLKVLVDARGRLVTYDSLLQTVWPEDDQATERSKVRALIMYLRNKLQEDLSNPQYILTDAGVGYRLNM